ncbi:MAG: 30S ribosomal protein S3 [Candidatus Lokiarchaeota archaeon]|nr:30S ribosomal protein S3 [Candidatus Lokiarchaeota archaeon]
MPLKRAFVQRGIQLMQIDEYLAELLDNSGYAGVELQKRYPLGYQITIKTARPGLVIGRKGVRIREIGEKLTELFGLENPQIDVEAVENPELNSQIMAEAIAFGIRKGQNYRRTAYNIMRRIIRAGARGVEVKISGKSTSQRARTQIFRAGIISKCGAPAIEGVDKGVAQVVLKSGTIGIVVKIMPLDYQLPDEIILKDPELKARLEKYRKKQALEEEVEGGDPLIDKDSKKVVLDAGDEEDEEDFFDDVEEDIEDIEVEEAIEEEEETIEEIQPKEEPPQKDKKKRTRRNRTTKKKNEDKEE